MKTNRLHSILLTTIAAILFLFTACQSEQTPPPPATAQAAAPAATLPVYDAHIGILDTLGGPFYQFIRDTLVYALQDRYAYIDTSSELHITTSLDQIAPDHLHLRVPYAMRFRVYDGIAPRGNNAQVVQLSFTSSGASSLSRTDFADRPEYTNWDRTIHQSQFPTCTTTDYSCKARLLYRDIARLAFL